MNSCLIIKTGAAGDVVRTSCLLHAIKEKVYWVTDKANKALLDEQPGQLEVLSLEEAFRNLPGKEFNQVISLEEDPGCAKLAGLASTKSLTGVFLSDGKLDYTDDSAPWFDMSRISKFGMEKANRLKAANLQSYQHFIFSMLGKEFKGEPYKVYTPPVIVSRERIGIEKRSGKQWPNKRWWGYDKLEERLVNDGMDVISLSHRADLRDYLQDIASCSHIVSGDTLAMHIALAYNKTCTAIFNCTSPQEIYDYGLLNKVISPLLSRHFYHTSENEDVINSVSLQSVYETIPGLAVKK